MKHKIVIKNRFVAILFAVLLCVVSFGCGIWQLVNSYADTLYTYELTSVEVKQNDGWIFTSNTPDEMLYRMVSVTVTYNNIKIDPPVEDKYVLEFTDAKSADGIYATKSGEKVKFARVGGDVTVTVVELRDDAGFKDGVSGEVTGNFVLSETSNRVQNGIYAEFDKNNAPAVTSATRMDAGNLFDAINIYYTYNDGSRATDRDTETGKYQLSGSFFPEDLYDFLTNPPSEGKYNVTLTVSEIDGNKYSTTVVWEAVTFEEPEELGSRFISGRLPQQYARSELNLDGLTVQLVYVIDYSPTAIDVPLSVFKKYLTIQYFDSANSDLTEKIKETGLTTAVTRVSISFTYPGKGWSFSGSWANITIAPLAIHVPQLPDMTGKVLSWNDGASMEIGNWDFDKLYETDPPVPKIKAVNKYNSGEVYSEENETLTTTLIEGVKTVEFPRAGVTYVLTIVLPSGGDFQWSNPPQYVKRSDDNFILEIEVQVEKGTPEITLDDIADVIYGTPNGVSSISAKIEGSDMGRTWTYERLVNQADASKYVNEDDEWHYYLKYYTSYTDEKNNTPVPEADLRKQDGKPKTANTYYVVAVTYENSGYNTVCSKAVPFKVKPFEIQTQVADREFERRKAGEEWTIADFLTDDNDFPYTGDPYYETPFAILSITDSSGSTVDANTKFIHSNKYTVEVAVNADASKKYTTNYVLSGSSTISFSIKTDTKSTFDFDVKGWTYGATNADPQIKVTKSDTYYPSNTGNIDKDFVVKYYEYKSGATDNKGTEITGKPFSEFGKGMYVVELKANKNTDYPDEIADYTAGTTVDYILKVVCHEFEVTASPIKAPYLTSPWASSRGEEGQVYRYDDTAINNYAEFSFINWLDITNEAADKSPIITVTVKYTTLSTVVETVIISYENGTFTLDFDGKFRVSNAGHYEVIVTLNKNYSWDSEGQTFKPSGNEYSFYGKVERQQLTVLNNVDVTGKTNEGAYNGSSQVKTVGNWNSAALKIDGVEVTGLYTGHTPVAGGIVAPTNTKAPYDNTFSIVNAGKYSVWVDIADKDNYEWLVADGATGEEANELRRLELYYELDQATLQVQWKNGSDYIDGTTLEKGGDYPKFEFDGTKDRQATPEAKVNVAFSADNVKLSIISYQLYSEAFSNPIISNIVNEIGHFYIAVDEFGGEASANYKLGDIGTHVGTVFEIYAFKLDKPEFTGSSIEYDGVEHNLTSYINNYAYYLKGKEYCINVDVFVDGNATGISVKKAGTYTVKITIANDNFTWKDGDSVPKDNGVPTYTFTFVIEQRMVSIEWTGNLEVVYNLDGNAVPTYAITNIAPDGAHTDKVELELAYKPYNNQTGEDVEPEDAGEYLVYASGLKGADSDNYVIVISDAGKGTSNYSAKYTVLKKGIAKPSLTSSEVTFQGKEGKLNIPVASDYKDAQVVVRISGEVPSDWFDSEPASNVTIFNNKEFAFDSIDDVVFNYTRAGRYTFAFSIKNVKNYHWDGDGKERDFTHSLSEEYEYDYGTSTAPVFTVDLMELTAPIIGKEKRAQDWTKTDAFDFGDNIVSGVSFDVMYGTSEDASPTSHDWLGMENGKGKQGIYYAELTLSKSAGENDVLHYLNYKWNFNDADRNDGKSGYLFGYPDTRSYTADNVTLRLYYAITLGQLNITIKVSGYTFGDNGIVGERQAIVSFSEDRKNNLDTDFENNTVYLTGDTDSLQSIRNITTKITDVQFTIQSEDTSKKVVLVNGLPWEQGTYILSGTLVFGNGEDYQNLPVECKFTVDALAVDADWIKWIDPDAEYSATEKTVTAEINSDVVVIKKDSGDTDVYTTGLQFTVSSADGRNLINADTYTVKIASAYGNDNFKLPDDGDITHSFTITAKNVTVTATAVGKHVYLDEILADEKKFNDDGFYSDGAESAVEVKICKEGQSVEIGRDAHITDEDNRYYVTVGWKANAGVHATNYNVTFEKAEFVIVAREITVEWDSKNATGVYGNNVINLYSYITATASNGRDGVDDAFADKDVKHFITLTKYEELDAYTAVGSYYVEPVQVASDNWVITFTDGADWKYVITEAEITEVGESLTPKQLKYIADWQTVFAAPQVNIEKREDNEEKWQYGVVASESDGAEKVSDWEDMTGNNISVYTAGTYYFVIKITAKNHSDFTRTVKVEVQKATLNVRFDFAIMYGEVDPATNGHMFDSNGGDYANIRTQSEWKVTGFVNEKEETKFRTAANGSDFYNLKGDAKYSVVGYVKGDFVSAFPTDGFEIEYDGFTLQCDNYEFTTATGKLTVNKIQLTITGKTLSVEYNAADAAKYVVKDGAEGEGYTVTHPSTSYNSAEKYVTDFNNYKDYFELSSEAFTLQDNPTTAGVGEYTLEINPTETESPYYDITGVDGKVKITSSELINQKTIEGYHEEYDENYHGLIVNMGGDVKLSTVDEATGKLKYDIVFAEATDGTAVKIEYYEAESEPDEITEDYLKTLSKLQKGYIDCDAYYIVYKIWASDNYNVIYGYRQITIDQTTNWLSQNFDFVKDKENRVTLASELSKAKVAWTYGYGDDVTDGFNPNGDQEIINPEANYTRANKNGDVAKLKYTLSYATGASGGVRTVLSGDYKDVEELFTAMFQDGLFIAGYYRLTVSMDTTQNFSFVNVDYVFRIAKRTLTIKTASTSTIYGEAAPEFKPIYVGLVSNRIDGTEDTIDDVISKGYDPNFITEYVIGDSVGDGVTQYKYRIYANIKVTSVTNYEVEYEEAWLTVKEREITITIDDHLDKTKYNEKNTVEMLTFSVVSGSIYGVDPSSSYNDNNQNVLRLYTDALTGYDSATGKYTNTNDVKFDGDTIVGYTIYAEFKGNAKYNYIVKFSGCSMKEDRDEAIGCSESTKNAGTYVINQAICSIDQQGVWHIGDAGEIQSTVYSGAVNYYKAYLEDPNHTPIPFTYTKEGSDGEFYPVDEVKDVGRYQAIGSATNMNYVGTNMKITFTITEATLTLKAGDATVEYGTTLSGNVTEDIKNGVVKDNGAGRFTGFTYTAESKDLIASIVKYYADNTADGKLVRYRCEWYEATTAANRSGYILPVCEDTYGGNVKIEANEGTLKVLKRQVEVTIVGWDEANAGDPSKHNPSAWCYYKGSYDSLETEFDNLYEHNYSSFIFTDETETFGDAGIRYGALGITLELPKTAVDVNEYEMSWKVSSETNYEVTVTNSVIAKPKFSVQKAHLTLYAYDTVYGTKNYSGVAYGDSIELTVTGNTNSAGFLCYSVDGIVGTDQFVRDCLGSTYNVVFTVKFDKDSKDYTPWVSGIGAYTVDITRFGDVFKNYIVVNYVTASLKIEQRKISASTENQKFDFDGTSYNNGLYGKSHEAEITFANAWSEDYCEGNYQPVYSLKYSTTTLSDGGKTYQTAGKAPTVVGKYTVTVILESSGNYAFDSGVYQYTLSFEVTKKTVSAADLRWLRLSMLTDDYKTDNLSNIIENYQSGYMTVARFEFTPMGGNDIDVNEGNAETLGTYYFDNGGALNITLDKTAIGRYTVRIELLPTAKGNIDLISGTENVDFVNATFDVTTERVTMGIEFSDFKYGEEPGTPTVYINGVEATGYTIFRYALITDESLEKVIKLYDKSSQNQGLSSEDIADLKYGGLTIAPNFVAGYYVLYAQYRADVMQDHYYVFKVDKKDVGIPKVENTEFTYNGADQSIKVTYDATELRPTIKGGSMTVSSDGIYTVVTFTVCNAGDYEIKFVLVDSANTAWSGTASSGGATVDGDTVTYNVNVSKDNRLDNDPTDPVVTVPERIRMSYGDTYAESNVEIKKSGYDGVVTLYYMVNTNGKAPDIDAEWIPYSGRLDANSYWIKAVVTDISGRNYLSKSTVGEFIIDPKVITATISGEITYGDSLQDTQFEPVVEGLLPGDKWTPDGYSYKYYKNYNQFVAGGEYYIILETNEDGSVKGINAGSNYRVTAVEGRLTVNKRNITIGISGKLSYYAVAPDLSDVEYTLVDGTTLAPNDRLSDLGIKLVVKDTLGKDVTKESPAGGEYWITIYSYDETNYVISYQRALYVVNPLEIEIALEVQQNIVYGNAVWGARLDAKNSKVTNENADMDIVKNLTLTLRYTGTSYAGVPYDSDEAPSAAGVYVAKVMGAGSNYSLVGMPEVEFTIQKRTLYDSELYTVEQTYTGAALTPVISAYNDEIDSDLYSVIPAQYVNAGTYDVSVSLNDSYNYQWESTPGATTTVKFTIAKATDEEVTRLTITGWQYGRYSSAANSPFATVKSGGTIYYEYSADGVTYTNVVPENGNVGTYYVRVTVAESANFKAYEGEAVAFEITKYLLTVPKLTSNDNTYTGSELIANISDIDIRFMSVMDESDARTFIGAAGITAVAINAGVYNIYIALTDIHNFGWLDGAGNEQGVLTLTWTIGKKKVALPTAGKNSFVVNGNDIVYIPDGFDESIMSIEKNVYSFGGNFVAVVTLKDTANYEWVSGGDTVELKWHITGADTVFIIILSVLLLFVVAGGAGIATQIILNKRRKRAEASAMDDIENKDVGENDGTVSAENSESGNTAEKGEKN